jgi:predicted PurR-regulated permease PerM
MNRIFKFFENRIIKNIFSIILALFLIFDIFVPLVVNAYFINNIKEVYPYINEEFDFSTPIGKIHAEKSPKFQVIQEYGFLIGIVNVDLDNNEFSKIISKCSFLGMDKNEIINEIKNKLRIKKIEYEEFFIKKKKEIYEYSIDKDKIIIDINSIFIDKNANPGIAIVFEVINSTIDKTLEINENFKLRSKCINDKSENLGKICIDYENLTLPNSIKLLKNEKYKIEYYPNEGYEFDHWEIYGGKLFYQSNSSRNILFIQNDYGEIIAYYKKIGISSTSTSTSITSMTSTLKTSSLKATQQSSTKSTYTTSIKTQSITSNKEETKIKTTITITQYTLTYSISKSTIETYKVIKEDEFEAKYESYYTYSSTNTISKTTYNTTSTIKKDKNIFDTIGDTISNIGKSILESTKDIIDKTINVVNDFVKKALDFINNINPFKGNTTITSSTTITNTIKSSTTSLINTKTSNTITTIFNYKYVITKTITTSTTSINTKTSTSYDIDKHIINNLNYYKNNVNNVIKTTNTIYYTVKGSFVTYTTALYTYTTTKKITSSIKNSNTISGGGGSPKALLRDSLLFNEELYKEFLKKIEENKLLEYPYIPCAKLKYLVFKIVPIRIEPSILNFEDGKINNITIVIKNYDNKDIKCVISIEDEKGKNNGLFFINSFKEIKYEDRKDILLKSNSFYKEKIKIISLPIIDLKNCEIIHGSIYYKKYKLSFYIDYNGNLRKIYEKEIKVWPSLSKFWKGFYKAIKDNLPSIALSTIALILIGIATSGSGTAVQAANLAMFAMFLYSVGMNILEVYYAYIGYDSFNKFVNERYNIIRSTYGNEIEEFVKNIEKDDIENVRRMYIGDRAVDFFINIEISDLLKIGGIIEVDEEEKGYAAGKIFVAAYSFTTFAIGYIHNKMKNKIIQKGGVQYVKEILKEWVSAPLIDAIAIFYKYRMIKELKENKAEISNINSKYDEIAKRIYEEARKDKKFEEILNNIENYVMDISTWSKYSKDIKEFIEENVKIDEDTNIKDIKSKIEILRKCSNIFYKSLAIANKIYNGEPNNKINGELSKDKVAKVLNAIGEEIKENRKIDETIFKEGLRKLGIEEVEIQGEDLVIAADKFNDMVKNSLSDSAKIDEAKYLVFRIFTEDKGPNFIITKNGEGSKEKGRVHFGGVGFRKRIGSDKFYIKLEDVIKNPKDWYNKLIKGKIEEIKINDNIIKILSENEIKIINEKTNLEETLKLENLEFNFITQGRFLGIEGDIVKELFDGIKLRGEGTRISILTDGDGNMRKEIMFESESHGHEITDIKLDDNKLIFKYYDKGEQPHLVWYRFEINSQDVKIDFSGRYINCYVSKRIVDDYRNAERNMQGAITEIISAIIEKKRESCESIEVIGGVKSREGKADLHIKRGKFYPGEVKSTGDYTIEEIKTNPERVKKLFEDYRDRAKDYQVLHKLKNKDFYKDSEYGIIYVIGIPKDAKVTNDGYVKIDVLIVKVYKDESYDILYKPSWYSD